MARIASAITKSCADPRAPRRSASARKARPLQRIVGHHQPAPLRSYWLSSCDSSWSALCSAARPRRPPASAGDRRAPRRMRSATATPASTTKAPPIRRRRRRPRAASARLAAANASSAGGERARVARPPDGGTRRSASPRQSRPLERPRSSHWRAAERSRSRRRAPPRVLAAPVDQARPGVEQRLVRDLDPLAELAVGDDQQAGGDQLLDHRGGVRAAAERLDELVGESERAGALGGDRVAEDLAHQALLLGRHRGEGLLGVLRERAADPAERAVGLAGRAGGSGGRAAPTGGWR